MTHSWPVAAFIAGLISFLSPCVLPLVPGYISVISGAGIEELRRGSGTATRSVVLNSVLFILGFTAVFLALGAVATTIGQLVRQHIELLGRFAGLMIVVLGLHQAGAVPIRLLHTDKRFHGVPPGAPGTRAFLLGSAFGFGWTPCVGPILAVILAFAATESTLGKGVSLLAFYAAGLALPFLLTAFSIDRFLAFYARFRSHLRTLQIAGGMVMVAVGVLMVSGRLVLLNSWLDDVPFLHRLAETPAPVGARANTPPTGFLVGESAPDFELRSLTGRIVRLKDLRGRPVLLNFWATWCAPCRVETPWLVEIDRKYRAQGLQVVGVSLDDPGAAPAIAAFTREKGVQYDVLFGNRAVADAYGGVRFTPETYFIDPRGKITKVTIGLTGKQDLEDGIKALWRG